MGNDPKTEPLRPFPLVQSKNHEVRFPEIVNKRGLHARASAKFVQCVERFNVKITVTRNDYTVDGKSIMGLMMLAAVQGSKISVCAVGPDSDAALNALVALISRGFDEEN